MTTEYAGWLRKFGLQLFDVTQQPWARTARMGGILARLRAVERIRLMPEGVGIDEMRRLTTSLRDGGCEVFLLTYHSPSIVAGHTPYLRSAADLEHFIATVHDYAPGSAIR